LHNHGEKKKLDRNFKSHVSFRVVLDARVAPSIFGTTLYWMAGMDIVDWSAWQDIVFLVVGWLVGWLVGDSAHLALQP
jgi:hypothetical protein